MYFDLKQHELFPYFQRLRYNVPERLLVLNSKDVRSTEETTKGDLKTVAIYVGRLTFLLNLSFSSYPHKNRTLHAFDHAFQICAVGHPKFSKMI